MQERLSDLARRLGEAALQNKAMLATAESCTAGGIAYTITEIAGSSAWFDRGFVTYTNASKQDLLGVNGQTLQTYGAVSEQTAREMALGALQNSMATLSVAVTGIAGPGGAVPGKPVGTVCFGFAERTADGVRTVTETMCFDGDRQAVRQATIAHALTRLIERIGA